MKKYFIYSLILSVLFISTNTLAINEDVKKAVLHDLVDDDVAAEMNLVKPSWEYVDDDFSREVETNPGLNATRVGDVVYFAQGISIKRYDMSNSAWLSEIVTNDVITAFSSDTTGIYVAHDRALYKYYTGGEPRTFFRNSPQQIDEIVVFNNFIVFTYGSTNVSLDKLLGTYIDEGSSSYNLQGITVLPNINKIFGRSQGVSPADIVYVEFDASGNYNGSNDSPYHGNYPSTTRVYSFPSESRIVDGAGIIYHAPDLTYGGSLAGNVDHVSFYGDLIIALRDGNLVSFSNTFTETGNYTPAVDPDVFFIISDTVFAFNYELDSVNVETYDISLLTPDVPGEPVDPNGLIYSPDSIEYDGGDFVYLLHRNSLTIFKYNLRTKTYATGIPLVDAPMFMTHSIENNRIYLAYADGRITQINPAQSNTSEMALVNSPQQPCGLSMAGEFILVCDPSGAWVSHFIYSSSGVLIDQEEWNYYSHVYKWSDVNRKVYHFRDDTSPNDLLSEVINVDGTIGEQMDSPYHGGSWIPPLCVNPNGNNVVIGSGIAYDATTLAESNFLSNNINGCGWIGEKLYSLSNETTTSDLQSWSSNFEGSLVKSFAGSPIDLINVFNHALVIISNIAGIPTFNIYEPIIFENGFE